MNSRNETRICEQITEQESRSKVVTHIYWNKKKWKNKKTGSFGYHKKKKKNAT